MELDIQDVCDGIHMIAKRLNLNMELTPSALYTMILHYIDVRATVDHPFQIQGPRRRVSKPAGWAARNEEIWVQWLEHRVPLDLWNSLIMDPVFGDDIREWEIGIEGWRNEIYTFMPFWFVRSMPRFDEIDPTMLPDEDEEYDNTDERKKQDIDPYLADYYERR